MSNSRSLELRPGGQRMKYYWRLLDAARAFICRSRMQRVSMILEPRRFFWEPYMNFQTMALRIVFIVQERRHLLFSLRLWGALRDWKFGNTKRRAKPISEVMC